MGERTEDKVRLFQLGGAEISVEVLNVGALLHTLKVPDKNGKIRDVVLGFDQLERYRSDHPSIGLTVGRFANRISKATFTLDGKVYHLPVNDGENHLHGGNNGFGQKFWTPRYVSDTSVTFFLHSPDGDQGYPGNMETTLTYTVQGSSLILDYAAASGMPTPVNLTNHAYFNLAGGMRDVLDHEVQINASRRIELDENLIPTDRILDVAGSGYDLRKSKSVGKGLRDLGHDQGFDLCYVIDPAGENLPMVAEVFEPDSGLVMEVFTSEPGIQFYTANFLDGSLKGKGGVSYGRHFGLCLETQQFPDAPNHPSFPDCILRPGKLFRSRTIYSFSVRK